MSVKAAEAKFGEVRRELIALNKRKKSIEDSIAKAKKPGSNVSDARIKSLNQSLASINVDIKKAEGTLRNANQILSNIRKIEETDKSLVKNYDLYKQAIARGENASVYGRNIEALFKQRGGLMISGISPFVDSSPVPINWKAEAEKGRPEKEVYRGSGVKKSPLTLNGKPFTGTRNGKQYKDGILVKPEKTPTPGGAPSPGGFDNEPGPGAGPGAGDKGKDDKGKGEGDKGAGGGPSGSGVPDLTPDGIPPVIPTTATGPTPLATLLAKTEFWFDLPDYIFTLDKELGDLLVRAVDEGWDNDRFESALKLTKWVQRNAESVRKRIISRAKYNELRAAGEDVTNTEYARDTASLRRNVQDRARRLGATLTDEQLDQVVGKIYDGFLDNDSNAITRFIAPYIGKVTSIVGTGLGTGGGQAAYTGEALTNYQELQRIARANGLRLEDVLPQLSVPEGSTREQVILQKLATGELDVNAIAQTARQFAATGQPDYVRNLLNQGYDLEQVFAPYRNVMASTLELNADQIDLNDPTLRGAITKEGDMNIYDFKKLLRKDSRWDTTENAREEVSGAVYSILRDFGFQG